MEFISTSLRRSRSVFYHRIQRDPSYVYRVLKIFLGPDFDLVDFGESMLVGCIKWCAETNSIGAPIDRTKNSA